MSFLSKMQQNNYLKLSKICITLSASFYLKEIVMPFLTIHTNATLASEKIESLLQEGANLIASELHKPMDYVVITLDNKHNMSFGGSSKNIGALVEMKSIGFSDKTGLAKVLTEFLHDRLQADLPNINIEFIDMPASTLAIGGRLIG